jgi:DNA-binding NarL/FixJ family response regulator
MDGSKPVRILLADDHEMIRAALRALLQAEEGLEVVAETGDGLAAVRLIEDQAPDVVVMDLRMPGLDGIQATRRAVAAGVRVVVASAHADARTIREALAAGAAGYVLKDRAVEELPSAIRTVAGGGVYISPGVVGTDPPP